MDNMNSSWAMGTGSQRSGLNQRIRGSHKRIAMPGDGEHDTVAGGVGHHDGGVAVEERPVEHDVRPWLGAIIGVTPGSARRRTESVKGPVAR